MDLVISQRAESEALEAWYYYESRSFGLGDRFLGEMYDAIEKIASNPNFYSFISGRDFRDLLLKHFPFVIVYQVLDDNLVFVISVHNTHKDPSSI